MKKVYICSPCRGDYENNIQRAKEYSRAAAMQGCIPITPHIYLTQFMDDTVPAERELALSFGRELVLQCDELWAFGIDNPTDGMAAELAVANDAGIIVRNGFEAISTVGEQKPRDNEPALGIVTIHTSGRRSMLRGVPDLEPMTIEIPGEAILQIAEALKTRQGNIKRARKLKAVLYGEEDHRDK